MALRAGNNRWLNIWLVWGEKKRNKIKWITDHKKISRSGEPATVDRWNPKWCRRQWGTSTRHCMSSSVYVFKTLIIPAEVVSDWASIRRSIRLAKARMIKQKDSIPSNKEINHSPKKYVCCFLFAVCMLHWMHRTHSSHSGRAFDRRVVAKLLARVFAFAVIISFSLEMWIVQFLLHCIDGFDFPCNFIRPPKPKPKLTFPKIDVIS